MRACLTSRYTEPKNPKGTDSWNKRPLTITKSPTVMVPTFDSLLLSNIIKYYIKIYTLCYIHCKH